MEGGECGVGNEKGDVRGAAGILSVIKCRKGAHDDDDGRGARPEYNAGDEARPL